MQQLQYCEDNGIPFAIIIGEEEIKNNVVKLRDVNSRNEVSWAKEQSLRKKCELNDFFILLRKQSRGIWLSVNWKKDYKKLVSKSQINFLESMKKMHN